MFDFGKNPSRDKYNNSYLKDKVIPYLFFVLN